ncbi:MAG: sulfite exporter TauE/SafE family protein [Anaerolineae bacterium]
MIGLGGAEFRLPALAGLLRHPAKQAVPLNLAVSLVTIVSALVIRSRTLSSGALLEHWQTAAALILGAAAAAFWGAAAASRTSEQQLTRVILILLISIGLLLIVEAFLPLSDKGFLPANTAVRAGAGVLFGLAIGLVSSLLGVAGGELIIPTLLFAFGVDIRAAGTLSLVISTPTVLVGVGRYAHQRAFQRRALLETVAPMGAGSIIGAAGGALLAGIVAPQLLKVILGGVLIFSAFRIFRHTPVQAPSQPDAGGS